jgi:DNA polymerase-4
MVCPIRKIIHIDMDAFYASVECRDQPGYRGQPVAVGGLPSSRGVIAAASYEAREYGVHSAMPSALAVKKCPHLILVRPRFDVYQAVCDQIREIFLEYTDLVEPLSLDEAYLDVTTNKKALASASLIAKEVKERILETTQLTASAGVSVNKFLAKTASCQRKPNGFFLIPPAMAESFVAELPIERFHGIGPVTAEKMRTLGIHTGADLKKWSEADLIKTFGKVGFYYHQIARGIDDRPVEANRIRKSVGAEESFASDLTDVPAMLDALREIAETLERRMVSCSATGRTLTLKVKYTDYVLVTRSRTFVTAISRAEEMLPVAAELLRATEVERKHARLLGLAISQLDGEKDTECQQLTLNLS